MGVYKRKNYGETGWLIETHWGQVNSEGGPGEPNNVRDSLTLQQVTKITMCLRIWSD